MAGLRLRTGTGLSSPSMGGGAPAFDGIDNLYSVLGVRTLLSTYTGPLIRIRRGSDNVEADFSAGPGGWLDKDAITTWLGGADGFCRTVYAQNSGGLNAGTGTAARQPRVDLSGSRVVLLFERSSTDGFIIGSSTAFGRNAPGLTLVSFRKLTSAPPTGTQEELYIYGGASIRARLRVMPDGLVIAQARRGESGAIDETAGLYDTRDWAAHVSRVDFTNGTLTNRLVDESESVALTGTPGPSADVAASQSAIISIQGTNALDGYWAASALISDVLTDAEEDQIVRRLQGFFALNPGIPNVGSYGGPISRTQATRRADGVLVLGYTDAAGRHLIKEIP